MYITRNMFNPNMSQAEVDKAINELLVTVDEFSRIACLDGRMYGVTTKCDTCDESYNACIRQHLIAELYSAQIQAEKTLCYALTPRYWVDEFEWDGREIIQLKHPGVESVNVVESIGDAEPHSISPFVQEDLTLESEDNYCVIEFDRLLTENPTHAIVRDSNNEVIQPQNRSGFPAKDNGNWRVALNTSNCDGTFNLQNCKYMILDINEVTQCLPVYPGSLQKIPLAKDPEIGENSTRFWFHPWVLADNAFLDEGIDLYGNYGEFYKLLDSIDLRCFDEEEQSPVVTVYKIAAGESVFAVGTQELRLEIIDKTTSTLHVEYGTRVVSWLNDCNAEGTPMKLRIYYKTNPDNLAFPVDYVALSNAISYMAASKLSLDVCGCEPSDKGFIKMAQTQSDKVKMNAGTGDIWVVPRKPGEDLFGEVYFLSTLRRLEKHHRSVRP